MSSKEKTISDIIVIGIIQIAIRVRGIVFIPVISIYLGVGAFGAYAQILALTSLLELVFGLGLYGGLVRFGQKDKYDLSNLYFSYMFLSFLSGLIVAILFYHFSADLSAVTLGTSEYAAAFQIGSALILTNILSRIGKNYFRVDSRMKIFGLLEGIKAYASIISVAYIVLFEGMGISEVILVIVLVEAIFVLLINFYIIWEAGFTSPSFPDIKDGLRYSIPLSISSLGSNLSSRADRILIGVFLGDSAVGIYSIAYELATGMRIYTLPIRQTFFPEFSRFIENGEIDTCKEYIDAGVRYFLMISIPTVGGLYLIGPTVASLLVGTGEPVPTAALMVILATGLLLSGVDRMYSVVLDANDRTARVTSVRLLGAFFNIILNLLLIPEFGVVGAAFATLLTYAFTVFAIYLSINIIKQSIPTKTLISSVLSTIVMVYTIRLFNIESIILVPFLGSLLYFTLLFAFGELNIKRFTSNFDYVGRG
ncbi:oligosaccharide flippase family protein [Natronolimnobius sp. AArcel1]|uniref:oligosaccharide flippase family protein n=1 Tax=Natronolimnobius sp. AArcel1 TaxID=1679093 RepID=UPI0013ECA84E|nr:oligosaccharide flippase family protein [Natronolimnobius sp. AArcel1]NGM71401.1 oligosaccharide flippase family protein [Natronolimnobius sp. AArcel1]